MRVRGLAFAVETALGAGVSSTLGAGAPSKVKSDCCCGRVLVERVRVVTGKPSNGVGLQLTARTRPPEALLSIATQTPGYLS